MNRSLYSAAFVAGLAALCWIGFGYLLSNPWALAMTLLIGVFYLMGTWELLRFRRATASLSQALVQLNEPPAALGPWLDRIDAQLQNAVRLRIDGERVGLPGPALTPYLAGLLVLLGMLGTFLGMVATLKGTALALDGAASVEAVRTALSAPVKGLGLAFGTSVAGVAASAMLGLMSALCRRERLQAGQLLDAKVASTLHGFSQGHRREESFRLLQRQADAMPVLVDALQAMMAKMDHQAQELNTRLLASQEDFHQKTEAAYAGLAASVDRTLKHSLAESARTAGAAIPPMVEAAMADIARQTSSLHESVSHTVQRQLEGLGARFEASTTAAAGAWQAALAEQQRGNEQLLQALRGTLGQFAETFEQRSAALLTTVNEAQGAAQQGTAEREQQRLARWSEALEAMADSLRTEWRQVGAHALEQQQQTRQALEQTARDMAALVATVNEAQGAARQEMAAHEQQRLAKWSAALEAMATSLRNEWQQAGAHALEQQQQTRQALEQTAHRMIELLDTVNEAQGAAQHDMAEREQQRLAKWSEALEAMAASLRNEWQQAGVQALEQQQQICHTLEQTARNMSQQAEAHTRDTIAEIARLVQTASQAPQAAADVIAELRQHISEGMARDNAVLEERGRIMQTMGTLLETLNHACGEQRAAIDALVSSSAALLESAGSRLNEQVAAETGKMDAAAAQLTASAAEVSSLGEAFGFAVQLFSESTDKLLAQLKGIEGALGKSLARSDEQLAYYVAQAREVIDLSIMSQKQVIEGLQQVSTQQAAATAEA